MSVSIPIGNYTIGSDSFNAPICLMLNGNDVMASAQACSVSLSTTWVVSGAKVTNNASYLIQPRLLGIRGKLTYFMASNSTGSSVVVQTTPYYWNILSAASLGSDGGFTGSLQDENNTCITLSESASGAPETLTLSACGDSGTHQLFNITPPAFELEDPEV